MYWFSTMGTSQRIALASAVIAALGLKLTAVARRDARRSSERAYEIERHARDQAEEATFAARRADAAESSNGSLPSLCGDARLLVAPSSTTGRVALHTNGRPRRIDQRQLNVYFDIPYSRSAGGMGLVASASILLRTNARKRNIRCTNLLYGAAA